MFVYSMEKRNYVLKVNKRKNKKGKHIINRYIYVCIYVCKVKLQTKQNYYYMYVCMYECIVGMFNKIIAERNKSMYLHATLTSSLAAYTEAARGRCVTKANSPKYAPFPSLEISISAPS